MINEVLMEMSRFIAKERLEVLELRLKHGDVAEAQIKAQMIAEMEYFYERLIYANKQK